LLECAIQACSLLAVETELLIIPTYLGSEHIQVRGPGEFDDNSYPAIVILLKGSVPGAAEQVVGDGD
jgi:hypothetical protein